MESENFCGKLKTIRLVSELSLYCMPEDGTEVRQQLTITRDGRGYLTRFIFSPAIDDISAWRDEDKRRSRFQINPENAEQIMKAFETTFSNPGDEIIMACDAGCWNLELKNEEGKKFRWSGSLLDDSFPGVNELSDLVREKTGIEDLFVFDGCPDRIEELGEFFDEDAYSRKKRRESELIFCKVIFQDAEKEYTYLADEDIYEKGDFAWAPAGKDNEEKIVRVMDVEYLQPEEAPFPVEKTKKLIRKLTPEEYERYVEEGKEPESFEYTHGKISIQVNIDHGKNRE